MGLHHVATPTRLSSEPDSGADPRLHGHWLVLARTAWGTVVVLAVGLLSATLPAYFRSVFIRCTTASCRSYVQDLHALGLTVNFYAWYLLGLYIVMVFGYLESGTQCFWKQFYSMVPMYRGETRAWSRSADFLVF
jgi:hypothetical protein